VKKDKKRILEEVARVERMAADVRDGKEVRCTTCELPLKYYGPGSGRHPGIYCPTGCTAVMMEFKRT
jgi:hypothetical protein